MGMASPARVLVVEDESDIASLIKHALERGGDAQVAVVGTGDAAIRSVGEAPPDLALVHKSGRLVTEEISPMHDLAFPEGCIHAENVGGDIEKALTTRCIIAFFDVGPLTVEEVREAMGKKPA